MTSNLTVQGHYMHMYTLAGVYTYKIHPKKR